MLLKRVKRTVLSGMQRLGAFDLLRDSNWRRDRLLIVGYHGVSLADEHLWNPQLYISPTLLESRLAALRRGRYNVLQLAEAVERLAAGDLPPRSVVLTFDDGFADFILQVSPLLGKYELPATVYMTTYYSNFNRPIFGLFCSYLLWKARHREIQLSSLSKSLPAASLDLRTSGGREKAHDLLIRHAETARLSAAEKDGLARQLAGVLDIDYQDLFDRRILRLLTPDEIRTLSAAGIDFQLHTHRHRTPVQQDAFAREIIENRQALARLDGHRTEHFCYPSGVYETPFFDWLRSLGVKSATTCDTGIVSRRTDPLLMPRLIDTMNLAPIEFESWLTGAGAFLPLRAHRPTHG